MKENISSDNHILSNKSNKDQINGSFDEEKKILTAQVKKIVKNGSKLKRLNTFSCNTSTPSDSENKNQIRYREPEILNKNDLD